MTLCNRLSRAGAILSVLLPLVGAGAPSQAAPKKPVGEMRCGWIVNPTPGNWWLTDSSAEWVIGMQGGYQAPGMDLIPDLSEHDWVVTNGSSYGYGCAFLRVATDAKTKHITAVHSVTQKPIKVCRADRKLPKP